MIKLYKFELLFFDGTVITGEILCWCAFKQPIYLSIHSSQCHSIKDIHSSFNY